MGCLSVLLTLMQCGQEGAGLDCGSTGTGVLSTSHRPARCLYCICSPETSVVQCTKNGGVGRCGSSHCQRKLRLNSAAKAEPRGYISMELSLLILGSYRVKGPTSEVLFPHSCLSRHYLPGFCKLRDKPPN